MLKNENSILAKDLTIQNQRNNLLQSLQIIWRVRENNVELFRATAKIEKSVGLYDEHIVGAEFLGGAANKGVVHGVYLDRCYTLCSARGKLVAHRAGAGKEIQHIALLEIDEVVEHVEQVLLRKIGCRSCAEVTRRIYRSALEFATNYSHIT